MRLVDRVASASGGTWELYKSQGVHVVRDEILRAGNSEHERAIIQQELKQLMHAAEEGRLEPQEDVRYLHLCPQVLELSLKSSPNPKWRLYFAWLPREGPLRLALKFAGKPPGQAGLAIQDEHILEAADRLSSWQRGRTR